jgi:predicted MPP superfamily phosphohydrolase
VCITGDVFHSARTVVEQATPVLKKLRARPLGNFVVLGNHDIYAGKIRSMESLRAAGLTLLRNEWISARAGSSTVHLGGIDDPAGNRKLGHEFPGFDVLMKKCPAGSGVRILLSHRPGVFPCAARRDIDLVLAGHTHGGQIVFPVPGRQEGVSVADIVSDYTQGWYRSGASRMYLNRGVGLTFLPWRIYCPPEIAVIRLTPARDRGESGFVQRLR